METTNVEWQSKTASEINPTLKEGPEQDSGAIISRLRQEADTWKRKYEEIFQEQCKTRSLETQLREKNQQLTTRLSQAQDDKIRLEARAEAAESMNEQMLDSIIDRVNKD